MQFNFLPTDLQQYPKYDLMRHFMQDDLNPSDKINNMTAKEKDAMLLDYAKRLSSDPLAIEEMVILLHGRKLDTPMHGYDGETFDGIKVEIKNNNLVLKDGLSCIELIENADGVYAKPIGQNKRCLNGNLAWAHQTLDSIEKHSKNNPIVNGVMTVSGQLICVFEFRYSVVASILLEKMEEWLDSKNRCRDESMSSLSITYTSYLAHPETKITCHANLDTLYKYSPFMSGPFYKLLLDKIKGSKNAI